MSSRSRSRSTPRVVKHSSSTSPTDPNPDSASIPSPSSLFSPSLPVVRYSRDELLAFSSGPLAPSITLPPIEFFQLRSKDQPQSSTGRKGRTTSNTPKPDSIDHSNNSNPSRRTRNRSSSPKGNKSHPSTKSSSGSSNSNSESWHQWQSSGNDREPSNRDRLGHRDFTSLGERRRNQDGHLTLERYSEWEIEQDKKNDETFGDSAGLGNFFDFAPRDFDPIASYKAERRAREGKRHMNSAPVDVIAQFREMMKSSKTDDVEPLTDAIDQNHVTDFGDDASINAMNDETFSAEADSSIPDEDIINAHSGPQGRFGRLFVDESQSVTSPTDDSGKPESSSLINTPISEEPTNTGSEQRQFQFLMSKIAGEKANKPKELSPVDTRSQRTTIAPNDPRLATSPPEPPSPPLSSHIPQSNDLLSQQQANLFRQQQLMYQQAQQLANANDSRAKVGAATPQYEMPEAVMQTQRRQHQFMLHHQQQQLGIVNHGLYPQPPGPIPPSSSSPYPSNMVNVPSEQEYLEALARERAVKKKAAALIAATSQMPTSVRRQQAAQNLPRPPSTNQLDAGYPVGVTQGIHHHPHALAQQQAARVAAQAAMFEQLRARAAPPHMFPGSHVHPPGGMMSPPYGPPHGSGPNMVGIRPRAPLPPHAAEAQSALYSFLQQHQNGSNPVNTTSPTTGSPPHTTSRQVNASTSPVSGTPPPRPPMMSGPMYGTLPPGVPNPNMYGIHPPPGPPPPGMYGPPGTTYGGPPRPYAPSPPHLLGGTPPPSNPGVPQLSQHVMTNPGHLTHNPPPGMLPGARRET